MVVLTVDFCCGATRQPNLSLITKLNLWGCDIDNIDCVKNFPNIKVLSLSLNNLSSLAACADCPLIEEIFLRTNKISDWNELRHLSKLPKLKILWLKDNPIFTETTKENYRRRVASYCPHLLKIDEWDVTEEERVDGRRLAKDNEWQRKIDDKMDYNLSSKSNALLTGMCCMAQNLDVNGLDILLTELKLRKMEIVSGGMKQAPPAPREPL